MAFDWKGLVGTVAPTLATALGGPMAGMAVKAIAGSLLGNENASEKEISVALAAASPETLLKLREADNAFEIKMTELGIDLERIAAGDRDSARRREVDTKDHTTKVLAGMVMLGWGLVNYVLITGGQDAALDDAILYRILGTLDAALMAVLYYYFGSSAGSKEKTQHLAGK